MAEAAAYATVDDVNFLWRHLTAEEIDRAQRLLPLVSDLLRQSAANYGRDLDKMIEERPTLASTAKAVTVDIVARILRQATTGEALSQETQSAMGYSWQGTYAIPGGGIANAIMRNDLKRLGLTKQKVGVIELYEHPRCDDTDPEQNTDGN